MTVAALDLLGHRPALFACLISAGWSIALLSALRGGLRLGEAPQRRASRKPITQAALHQNRLRKTVAAIDLSGFASCARFLELLPRRGASLQHCLDHRGGFDALSLQGGHASCVSAQWVVTLSANDDKGRARSRCSPLGGYLISHLSLHNRCTAQTSVTATGFVAVRRAGDVLCY